MVLPLEEPVAFIEEVDEADIVDQPLALVIFERPLVERPLAERPLVVVERPLVVVELPLVVVEPPLVVVEPPLVVVERRPFVEDEPLNVNTLLVS